ncbi:MAG: hypothetical protein H6832_01280 [Planctomycetes bacterium]|nr:hypothetical protein [Planctomycetota bacterium]MCB9917017.1 hypothetical protein [Planctomycetota bacterium]
MARKTGRAIPLVVSALIGAIVVSGQVESQARAIDYALDRAAAGLGATPKPVATEGVLAAARRAAKSEDIGERGAALLLLGLAQHVEDYAVLAEASVDPNPEIRHRATVALGLLGTAPGYNELARRLDASLRGTSDPSNSDAERAILAIALGLSGDASDSSGVLKVHALEILRRSRERHSEELAACLIGIPVDEGRSVFEQVLNLRTDCLPGVQGRVLNDTLVERIAVAAMSHRFVGQTEWMLVRNGLMRDDDDSMRRLVCLGLLEHSTENLDEKLQDKIARDLERRTGDRNPSVASLSLLALAKYDERKALSRARRIVDLDTRRPRSLDAAFLVIGMYGEKGDEARLRRWQARNRDAEAHAAWALATAELARRISPESFPPVPDETPRFPILALRAGLTESNTQNPLVRTAIVVALARLGDRESSGTIRSMFFTYAQTDYARQLATAASHLDSAALEPVSGSELDAQVLLGQSFLGTPRLWKPLEEMLSLPGIDARQREAAFRIASIALAGRNGSFEARLRDRVGPVMLPPTLLRVAAWMDPRATLAMMPPR